ncbi:MAG: MFS transporter, partial [Candidatus Cloacimonas sp. 4484_209]
MIFFAAGEAFRSGTHKAMILEYLRIKGIEHMKVEYYGHTRSVSQFGSAISSIIAIFIVFHSKSYRPIFLLSMIPYVLGLLLMLSYPKYLDGVLKETKDGFQNSIKNKFQYTWSAFIALFRTKEALKAIFNSSTFDGFFKSSKDYLQPILKAQTLALPVLLYFTAKQRTAIIVGIIYFILYLLTSTASRKSGNFVNRMRSLPFAVNITFITGGILLLISGISTSLKLYVVAIIALILLYVVQNLRRPMNVAYISDNISHRAMASGLSVESQIKTILMAILAPIIGYLADT